MTTSREENRLARKISKRDGDRVYIVKADGTGETGERWEMSRYDATREIWLGPAGYASLRQLAEWQMVDQ
jgi:hypothetical protein